MCVGRPQTQPARLHVCLRIINEANLNMSLPCLELLRALPSTKAVSKISRATRTKNLGYIHRACTSWICSSLPTCTWSLANRRYMSEFWISYIPRKNMGHIYIVGQLRAYRNASLVVHLDPSDRCSIRVQLRVMCSCDDVQLT